MDALAEHPEPSAAVRTFADELRKVKRQAGHPSYRAMADSLNWRADTLATVGARRKRSVSKFKSKRPKKQ